MHENTRATVKSLLGASQILVLLHEYLPQTLALWAISLVLILKDKGISVTVLVAEEPFGWGKKIDSVYPTDMVLSLEQLREVISIPIIGQTGAAADISSAVVANNLEITVVPSESSLDIDNLSVSKHGKTYDYMIGIGISAKHRLLDVISEYRPSLSKAKAYFIGTTSHQELIAEKLPFVSSVEVNSAQSFQELREFLQELSPGLVYSAETKELISLYIQAVTVLGQGVALPDSEGYGLVGKFADSLSQNRMVEVYSGDFAKQNRLLQQLLSSAQKAQGGNTVLYSISSATLTELGASVADALATLYYLPKLYEVQQNVVCIEENTNRTHVYINGRSESLKLIAIKYGFPLDELVTCGIVDGMSFEKVCQDVLRVVTKDEQFSEQQMPPIISVPKLIEALPEEDIDDYEADSGESLDSALTFTEAQAPLIEAEHVPTPVSAPKPVSDVIPTSPGIDFAAIAKKMRETKI